MSAGRLNMLVAVYPVKAECLILVRHSFLEEGRSPGTRFWDDSTSQARDSTGVLNSPLYVPTPANLVESSRNSTKVNRVTKPSTKGTLPGPYQQPYTRRRAQ